MGHGIYSWLCYNEFPVYTLPPFPGRQPDAGQREQHENTTNPVLLGAPRGCSFISVRYYWLEGKGNDHKKSNCMNTVFKIAKNEFRYLFFLSPLHGFAMIVFLVQCALCLLFSGVLYNVANVQDVMMKNVPSFTGDPEFTDDQDIPGKQGLWQRDREPVHFHPLLTMGLISRRAEQRNDQTIIPPRL